MSPKIEVFSHPPPDSGTYVERWAQGLRAHDVSVRELTIRGLVGSADSVVHVHWPEHLVRPGPPHLMFLRIVRTVSLFVLMFVQRNPVVWTAHNLSPHSGWRIVDRSVVALFHRLAKGVVATSAAHVDLLHAAFPRLASKDFAQIPLVAMDPGSEGERQPVRRPGPIRLLQFGSIAPYRGQLIVADALRELLLAHDCELTIVGRCSDQPYLEELRKASSDIPGLTIRAEHVSDEELRDLMLEADAAIGVQVDGLNTGVLPAALPLGLPVISADTPQANEIRDEIGEEWVFVVPALDDAAVWRRAVRWAERRRQLPTPKIFDVVENGRLHADFYEQLSAAR